MLPIGDRNPTRTTPFVNYVLLVGNIAAFLYQSWLMLEGGESWVVAGYGLVPSRFFADPPGEAFTIFTSMFMHGGWLHLGSNMLFLYVFGDNVEDAVGHFRYLLFYLACGVVAGLAQLGTDPSSMTAMVGASGAIAGVLGAYMTLYPSAPITVLNPIPLLWLFLGPFLVLPAWAMVGLWFIMNLFSGVVSLGAGVTGGVAFFAHVGGFIGGLILVRLLMGGRRPTNHGKWTGWRPPARRVQGYYR